MTTAATRSDPAGQIGPRWAFLVLLLALLLTLGVSSVVLWRALSPQPLVGPPGPTALQGGEFVVSSVSLEILAHNPGMPAGMMPDPLPVGQRRIAVDLTLFGSGDKGLQYDGGEFRISSPGFPERAPVRNSLGDGVVPAGAQIDGTLVFELPEDADDLTLSVPGSPKVLPLQVPEQVVAEHGAEETVGSGGAGSGANDGHSDHEH